METEIRLIDANKIVEVAEHAYHEWNLAMAAADGQRQINRIYKMQELCKAVKAVADAAPTVDAVPVVHGRWLANGLCNHKPSRFRNPDKWTVYRCSQCGYSNGRRKNAKYCPDCGAKMDGDGNGS